MNKFIFDVDGTITPSRQPIDPYLSRFFLDFCHNKDVYLITGSNYEKTLEQVGIIICNTVKKVYCCSGNSIWQQDACVYNNIWTLPTEAKQWLEQELLNSKFHLRTGNHIENRPGTINFSIVGRNANKQEREVYKSWDSATYERHLIVKAFNDKFRDLEAVVGGETGIDIYKKGNDKSQILSDFLPSDKLFFFGDKTELGGNDYSLANSIKERKLGISHKVNTWEDTYALLQSYHRE